MTTQDIPKQEPGLPDPEQFALSLPKISPNDEQWSQIQSAGQEAFQAAKERNQQQFHSDVVKVFEAQRESHPISTAIGEGLDAVGRLATGTMQVGVIDPVLGGVNLFRNKPIKFNLRDFAQDLSPDLGHANVPGMSGSETSKAFEESAGVGYQVLHEGADMAAWVVGQFGLGKYKTAASLLYGGSSKFFSGFRVFQGSALGGSLARGLGLGVSAAISGKDQEGTLGERAKLGLYTAATMPLYEGASLLANKVFGKMIAEGFGDANREIISKWASKEGLAGQQTGESLAAFQDRLARSWINSGSPGVKMSARAMIGQAGSAMLEGAAFNVIDLEYMSDEIDLVKQGKWGEAASSFLQRASANAMGLAFLKYMTAKWGGEHNANFMQHALAQRTDPTAMAGDRLMGTLDSAAKERAATEGEQSMDPLPKGDRGEADAANELQGKQSSYSAEDLSNLSRLGVEPDLRSNEERLATWGDEAPKAYTASEMPAGPTDPAKDLRPTKVDERQKPVKTNIGEPVEGAPDKALEHFKDAGETGPREYTLGGTDLSYRIHEDGTVTANPKLRRALDIGDKPIDSTSFHKSLERMLLAEHYQAKSMLPGEPYYPGITIVQSADPATTPSKLYTARAGRLYSQDLGSKKWKDEGPAKIIHQPETISPEQQQAADALFALRVENPPIMDHKLGEVLTAMDYALRTVNADHDVALKGLVDAINSGAVAEMVAASGGNPTRNENAWLEVAHMGTTKDPMVAMEDAHNRAVISSEKEIQNRQDISGMLRGKEGEAKVKLTQNEAMALMKRTPEGGSLGKQLAKVIESGASGSVKVTAEEASRIADYHLRSAEKKMELGGDDARPELQAAESALLKMNKVLKVKPERTSGEVGLTANAVMANPVVSGAMSRIGAMVKDAGKVIAEYYSKMVRNKIQRVADVGRRDISDRGSKANDDGKVKMRSVEPELHDVKRKDLRDLNTDAVFARGERSVVHYDEEGAGFSRSHIENEAALQEKLDAHRPALSETSQKVIQGFRDLFYKTGKWLEEAGALRENGKKFVADRDRLEMPRVYTEDGQALWLHRNGRVWDAFKAHLARLNGFEPAEVELRIADMQQRGAIQRDAAEFDRTFEIIPTHIKVDGKVYQVLEDRLGIIADKMVRHTAQRSSYISEFGADRELSPEDAKALKESKIEGDLPSTSHAMLLDVLRTNGRDAAVRTLDMVRALNGMPMEKPWVAPGDRGYVLFKAMSVLTSMWRSNKLGRAFVSNATELVGPAAQLLGYKRVAASTAKILGKTISGQAGEVYADLAAQGVVNREMLNVNISKAASVRETTSLIGQVITQPNHIIQEFNELVIADAGMSMVKDMQTGHSGKQDALLLRDMGYTQAEVYAMVNGNGGQLYGDFSRRIVGYLAGGTTMTSAERSRLSDSRVYKAMFAFQSYALARTKQIHDAFSTYGKAISEADGVAEKAAAAVTSPEAVHVMRMLASIGVGGAAQIAAATMFKDGIAGLAQALRNAKDNPDEIATQIVMSSIGNLPAMQVLNAGRDDQTLAETMARGIAPVAMFNEVRDYFESLAKTPDRGSIYEGHRDILDKTGRFLMQVNPLLGDAARGLFGMSSIAITEDPEIAGALGAFGKWKRDSDPTYNYQGGPGDVFHDNMRAVSLAIRDGKTLADDEVRDALKTAVQAKDWKSVHSSLMDRRVLADIDQDAHKMQSLRERIGDANLQTLRHYDRVLERMADWTKR